MAKLYLGKIHLHWCDSCHVPVLADRCSCGALAREVQVTPPGDVRPAFQEDVNHINEVYRAHFGAPLVPEGHLVLLNKVPATDRMEEIVMGGAVIGAIRYRADVELWEPLPRPAAARYMRPRRRFVVVDDDAASYITGGASVLAPGLAAIDGSVVAGDEVFVQNPAGECVAVGRARVDAAEAASMERGMVARTRRNSPATCRPGTATWDMAVAANRAVLSLYEERAIVFVKETAERHPIPANVSYSGGKDSLATLLLAIKALGPVPILFVDTGLEFAETCANVEEVAARYGLEEVRADGSQAFRDALASHGPPAVDARWCCRVAKLEPLSRVIAERWGECLSFIGQRKYESAARRQSRRVWRNSHVKCQVSAAPIQDWTALHVWLYLFQEDAPYNPLYGERLDRIGCFMCPASDIAILKLIEARYPEQWGRWTRHLDSWRTREDLPPEWITEGRWRRRGGAVEEDRDC